MKYDRLGLGLLAISIFLLGMAFGVVFMIDIAELPRHFIRYANYFTLGGSGFGIIVSIRQWRINMREKIKGQANG